MHSECSRTRTQSARASAPYARRWADSSPRTRGTAPRRGGWAAAHGPRGSLEAQRRGGVGDHEGRRELEPPRGRQAAGRPGRSPLRLGVTGGSSGPRPPGARLGLRRRRELGPCQGVDGAGRGATRPCSAAACIEAPVHVGVAAMVEHRHGRAQAHAHLRAHARGRRRHRRRRHSGRPPARLSWGRAAVALLRRVFVQGEGVAVDLGGSRWGGSVRGSAWEERGRSGHSPTHDGRHAPHAVPRPPSY